MLYRGSLSSKHMKSENTPISHKPEKYLVLSRQDIIAMYNSLKEQQIQGGYGSVILKCHMAGKNYVGQLQLTDECRASLYPYWPNEIIEDWQRRGLNG